MTNLLGRLFARVRWPWLFTILLLLTVGAISAFINNTAAVAILLPSVLAMARRLETSPSKLLIPLSFASLFGGRSDDRAHDSIVKRSIQVPLGTRSVWNMGWYVSMLSRPR